MDIDIEVLKVATDFILADVWSGLIEAVQAEICNVSIYKDVIHLEIGTVEIHKEGFAEMAVIYKDSL